MLSATYYFMTINCRVCTWLKKIKVSTVFYLKSINYCKKSLLSNVSATVNPVINSILVITWISSHKAHKAYKFDKISHSASCYISPNRTFRIYKSASFECGTLKTTIYSANKTENAVNIAKFIRFLGNSRYLYNFK